ncbi:shikimate 5-dehydrogenase [Skermanella stibiiresistens SB22]|uniref:Shikimate dehydrogenase (NADP(+)) n=1 Tax=Skermanella stibiiresistens SB22 TaxID=1385369 RepID=W9H9R4_9PROT|nr:shikimate dehydrogenase [Skermanella stibiiresistens]EWY40578.1 shikimate 5-dehydrogenase [Skermanella stibiiresistens SB22]
MILTAKAAVAGVMGWPVGHSRSPRLHGWWLDHHGIDGAYIPLAVPPDRITEAIRALPALGLRGANVTVPHKEAALRACDHVDPVARRVGAVNTLVVGADGSIEGRNTDGFGFMANLTADRPDWRAASGPAVVLGAGGAARAILVALADAGAPEIRLLNRTASRAEGLAAELGGPIKVIPWEDRAAALAEAALVVNTTTQGMGGQPALDLALDRLPPSALVTDIVYTPLHTPLLTAAAERGNPVVDGLGMLLHQARPGFEAWFGRMPEVTPELRRFVLESL